MMLRLKRKYLPYWQLYLFILPPLAYLILFSYVPMAGVQLAFKKFTILGGVWGSPWVGLAQFEKFVNSYYFSRVMGNTLRLSVYSIVAGVPFPLIFALILNSITHVRFKKTVQTITYMPHFISVTVIVGMMMQIFHPTNGVYGIISSAFNKKATDLFASVGAFPHMFVWSGIWQGFGWGSIIYLAALTSVNPELHEAAAVDGASRLKRIIHIDIPAIVPTVIVLLILRLGQIMNTGFEKIFLMQNDLNLRVSEVISTFVYKQGLGSGASSDYSYATAIGLFNSVINLLLISMANQLAKRCSDICLW